jgi:UPF0176 protein
MNPEGKRHKLVNRIERKVLMEKVKNEPFKRRIFSFYRYVRIEDPVAFRDELYKTWVALDVLGRIYVANEGINAQMNVPEHNWEAFHQTFKNFSYLQDITINNAVESGKYAFFKLDIRNRKRIVVDGLQENIFEVSSIGQHLSPLEFHEMVGQKDVIVVDARNNYECDIGHFEGAFLPKNKTFAAVLPEIKEALKNDKDKKILMYCTGGIRCEKASAYMKHEGFEKVFQLKGGIINYANEIKNKKIESKFKGSNYVFDERMSEKVTDEKLVSCRHCGSPHSTHVNCGHIPCHGLFVICPDCSAKFDGCCSTQCMDNKASMQKLI